MEKMCLQKIKDRELRDTASTLLKMMYPVPTGVLQNLREVLIHNLAINIMLLYSVTW
jgi:hypothetical protein